jgi:hypothetical protein
MGRIGLWRPFWANAQRVGSCWVWRGPRVFKFTTGARLEPRYVAWAYADRLGVHLGPPACETPECIRPEHQTPVTLG